MIFVDNGRIVDHHCLESLGNFVFEVIVCFVDIGELLTITV